MSLCIDDPKKYSSQWDVSLMQRICELFPTIIAINNMVAGDTNRHGSLPLYLTKSEIANEISDCMTHCHWYLQLYVDKCDTVRDENCIPENCKSRYKEVIETVARCQVRDSIGTINALQLPNQSPIGR